MLLGKLPAEPGDAQSLTIPGIQESLLTVNRTKFTEQEAENGRCAIHIAQSYMGRRKNFTGQHFWARGYFVSTVGTDEQTIREYIKRQEKEDQRLDQLNLFE